MASPLGAALWRGPVSCAWVAQKKHQCFHSGKEGGLPYVISTTGGGDNRCKSQLCPSVCDGKARLKVSSCYGQGLGCSSALWI